MNNNQNNGPVKFVNAEIRQAKSTGKHYLWSKPIDLDEIIEELGSLVTIMVTTPKNAKDEFQRTIVFKTADEQYAPKNNGHKNNGKGKNDYDEIPI